MTAVADRERDDPPVTDLVMRARNCDQQAWDALVERYAPLIWSICRRYGLGGADADDVGQTVWLHLVDQLDRLRDPAALAGWLATTTRRPGRIRRGCAGRTRLGPRAAGARLGQAPTGAAGARSRAGGQGPRPHRRRWWHARLADRPDRGRSRAAGRRASGARRPGRAARRHQTTGAASAMTTSTLAIRPMRRPS